MFITMPDFEMSIPMGLSPPTHKHWLAVGVSSPAPFFLLTYRVKVRRGQYRDEMMAIAWEKTLKEVLETPGLFAMSIYSISRMKGPPLIQRIEEVWIPSADETVHTGPLLFRIEGSFSLCDLLSDAAVPGGPDGRTLIFRMNHTDDDTVNRGGAEAAS